MDGLDQRRNVFVIAATNRPDIIDPAERRSLFKKNASKRAGGRGPEDRFPKGT